MTNIKLNVSQQRKFDGEVQLQSVGKKPAVKAENLMVGDVMMWNFGATSKVVEITPSKTGKTLTVITEYVDMHGEVVQGKRRFNADRLVAIQDLNPMTEEVTEATVEATEGTMTWYEVDVQTYYENRPVSFYKYRYTTKQEATEKINEAIILYRDHVGISASIHTYKVTDGNRSLTDSTGVGLRKIS